MFFDRPTLREVSPKKLAKILEAHRKWVESEGKEGKRADLFAANLPGADLFRANLQGANLSSANLQGAFLSRAKLQKADLDFANLQEAYLADADGLTASQVKVAKNWKLAFYRKDFLKELGLPPDHNERLKEKLAELEKEKKGTGSK